MEPGPEPRASGSPRERAVLRARAKAVGALAGERGPRVLGVDTVVDLDGVELGKPEDAAAAAAMLRRLAGRRHRVHTALCLRETGGVREAVATAVVEVQALEETSLADYLASGVWRGKAGAYGIQDPECWFVRLVAGDPDTVVGLPVALLRRLLASSAEEPP